MTYTLNRNIFATMQLAKVDFLNIGPSRDGPNRSVPTPLQAQIVSLLIPVESLSTAIMMEKVETCQS